MDFIYRVHLALVDVFLLGTASRSLFLASSTPYFGRHEQRAHKAGLDPQNRKKRIGSKDAAEGWPFASGPGSGSQGRSDHPLALGDGSEHSPRLGSPALGRSSARSRRRPPFERSKGGAMARMKVLTSEGP